MLSRDEHSYWHWHEQQSVAAARQDKLGRENHEKIASIFTVKMYHGNTWVMRGSLFYLEALCLSIPAENFDLGSASTASSGEQKDTSLACLV